MQELYPSRANQQGAGGRVQLDCTVRADLALACAVASESPAGMGFGRAALGAAAAYRAQPSLSDGTEAIGARTRIVVNFQAPSER
jgi:protein TonB